MDYGWKLVEVELEAIVVNGNGHHANGHDAIGPMVKLVPGNGHVPANDNGAKGNCHAPIPLNKNQHHDEADESQRTLFSWAEFMAEEPMKPKGRSRKPKSATASLFEWALTLEQEREAELVGGGC